jgi:hypothetical protein
MSERALRTAMEPDQNASNFERRMLTSGSCGGNKLDDVDCCGGVGSGICMLRRKITMPIFERYVDGGGPRQAHEANEP